MMSSIARHTSSIPAFQSSGGYAVKFCRNKVFNRVGPLHAAKGRNGKSIRE